MSGGPYPHKRVSLPDGTTRCSVCGHVTSTPDDSTGCPANVDMVRDWRKLGGKPLSAEDKAEKAAAELWRLLREGGG